jgi:hypothetical protein
MLKISEQRGTGSDPFLLRLEGRLMGPWVEELQSSWSRMDKAQQRRTVIDLTGVTFVDPEGKSLLSRMWQQGAEFRAAGCLTRCIVEEIRESGRVDASCGDHNATD